MVLDRQAAHEQGAVTILVAALLPALIGVAALVIDGGHLLLAHLRLQNAADAAALAATSALGRSRLAGGPHATLSSGRLETIARTIASHNWPMDTPLSLDMQTGRWHEASHRLVPSPHQPGAVSVRLSTTIPTYLAGVVGLRRWTLSARSTAALPSLGSVPAGTVTFPLGLTRPPGGTASPPLPGRSGTSPAESCLAILSFAEGAPLPPSAGGTSPALWAGRSQVRVVGTVRSRLIEDGLSPAPPPSSGEEVTTLVPVIEANRCPVAAGWYRVAGFATVGLRMRGSGLARSVSVGHSTVSSPLLHWGTIARSPIEVTLLRDRVSSGRGGGSDFGTLASSPVLVR